jgi:hypothetical protein
MTSARERADEIMDAHSGRDWKRWASAIECRDAIEAALLAEREAAAKVAEDWAGSCDVCGCDQARKIAEAIRETAQ